MLRSFALAALACLVTGSASAQLIVFRGDPTCASNATPGAIPIGGGPTQVLVCFDAPGTTPPPVPGQECVDGRPGVVCGVDVEIRTTGSVSMTGFTPSGDWVFNLTPTLLKTNGGNPLTGDTLAAAIGTVTVTATGAGTLEVTGRNSVDSNLALQTIGAVVLMTASAAADFDMDGIGDSTDACPTLANAGVDTDADTVDNACDTCTSIINVPVGGTSVAANRTLVSRQFDDDADGRGNACDFDYNNAGAVIDSTDFNQIKASIAKLMTQGNCGAAPTNAQRCGEFDHNGLGAVVDSTDFNLAKAAVSKIIATAFPKCAACNEPWSRPIGDPGGAPLAGKPVCQSAVGGACVY